MNITAKSGASLSLFILVALVVLLMVNALTEKKIKQSEQSWQLKSIGQLLPDYNIEALTLESKTVVGESQLGEWSVQEEIDVTMNEQAIASLFTTTTRAGYNGNIRLIIGVSTNGTILGVRVLEHQETPGLGDKIEIRKSDWIDTFKGLSLTNTVQSDWQTRKQGGIFDGFTGATITPNAVIKAVYKGLLWHDSR